MLALRASHNMDLQLRDENVPGRDRRLVQEPQQNVCSQFPLPPLLTRRMFRLYSKLE